MRLPLSWMLAVGALVCAGFLWLGWPSPERALRRQLQEMAELLSFQANEPPLNALGEINRLCAHLTPDVEVQIEARGFGRRTVRGREEIREGLRAYRQRFNGARVEFPDIRVELAPDRLSAVVYVTVEARLPGESDVWLQEMKLWFRRDGRQWQLARAETLQPLR